MGTLLDKPVIEKEGVEKGTANNLTFGVASMQGWRVDMEDSHYYNGTLGDEVPGVSIFAVFDGHGGQFAAKYAAEHIERILKEQVRTGVWGVRTKLNKYETEYENRLRMSTLRKL
ncbi:hypothetical protein TL16_g10016 [Triparma laevis f. inornata]|uniref:PPM-type phosphatase domain-containing protein n=1 Tax=Triparma laevis f. inornata TaxID=1714386 RepID=A0A9W7BB60_9STRA|nr:hypothetical protein TL16_g10016 [Triparma laevis f. inornata]